MRRFTDGVFYAAILLPLTVAYPLTALFYAFLAPHQSWLEVALWYPVSVYEGSGGDVDRLRRWLARVCPR